MEFTQEHEGIRRGVKKFIDTEINPHIDEWEEAGIFPAHDLFKKMGDQGFLGINKPAKYGGLGLDYSYQLVFLETLGHVKAGGVPMAIGVQTDMATPALARFGSEELRKEFLVPSIKGDYVACLGVSEVGAGSDVASIKTTAKKDGDDYVINGGKMWTTSGTQADWMCLLGQHVRWLGAQEQVADLSADEDQGRQRRPQARQDGHALLRHGADLLRRRARAAALSHRQGRRGLHLPDAAVPGGTAVRGAAGLIAKERMIEETIEYTGQRKAFGQSILDNQVVHFRLAELKTEVEMLRAITYRAADLMLKGEDVTMLASMAKLKSGRLSREISDACLQYWGGMGFMNETNISRAYRDTRLGSIGGGADEIMLSIICKHMGILPGKRNK